MGSDLDPTPVRVIGITLTGVGSRSDVNLHVHHPQTMTTGDAIGLGTWKYFLVIDRLEG